MRRFLVLLALAAVACAAAANASAANYLVLFKHGRYFDGAFAVQRAGGKVLQIDRLGIAGVRSSSPRFEANLRRSNAIAGVARDGAWRQPKLHAFRAPAAVEAPRTVPEAVTACGAFFGPQPGVAGPDPLNVCQWGMHIINATIGGSYNVDQGQGARVGILDTGIDATHQDIAPNLDVAHSCSFIQPGNPTAEPQEVAPTGRACGPTATTMWQDYAGHGTHVGGIVAAPINGVGVSGVAPKATLVALKVCNANGFCYTTEVVNGLIEAGNLHLDVANMSFFADPFEFNCHNVRDQQAIVKAIQRAAQYATNNGVTLIAAAGNDLIDLDHPPSDDPTNPGTSIGNNCVVMPGELSYVGTVSAIGPLRILAGYSNFSNSKVDFTAPGGDAAQTPGTTFGRILSAWSHTAPPLAGSRTVEQCTGPTGTPPCFDYVWISGTSMASPHAAGVAALIRAAHPGLPPLAVISMIQHTAQPMACTPEAEAYTGQRCTGNKNPSASGQTNFYGNGLVDAFAASLAAGR